MMVLTAEESHAVVQLKRQIITHQTQQMLTKCFFSGVGSSKCYQKISWFFPVLRAIREKGVFAGIIGIAYIGILYGGLN
jgi:hypothetical protein